MQESGAKRPAKLPQRESTEENDRADTSSDACQGGAADGDVPAHLTPVEVDEAGGGTWGNSGCSVSMLQDLNTSDLSWLVSFESQTNFHIC